LSDSETVSIVAKCVGRISELKQQYIADLVVSDRQIVLPFDGFRVGCSDGRQAKPYVEAPAVPIERVRRETLLIEAVTLAVLLMEAAAVSVKRKSSSCLPIAIACTLSARSAGWR
jgi:hypothetical protein